MVHSCQQCTILCPFFDFQLHFSIFKFEIFYKACKRSFEALFTISGKDIEKCCRKKDQEWTILRNGPFLVIFVTVSINYQ